MSSKPAIQYADVAEWQHDQATGTHSADMDYWKQRLGISPPVKSLPVEGGDKAAHPEAAVASTIGWQRPPRC